MPQCMPDAGAGEARVRLEAEMEALGLPNDKDDGLFHLALDMGLEEGFSMKAAPERWLRCIGQSTRTTLTGSLAGKVSSSAASSSESCRSARPRATSAS